MFFLFILKKLKINISNVLTFLSAFSQRAYAWNVMFNPQAPEIATSTHSPEMLQFLNTLINWTCTVICVYVGYKAAGRLHNSDVNGFIKTITASFIIGSAPYFSQYFLIH